MSASTQSLPIAYHLKETIATMSNVSTSGLRVDKWLWAARFFKTRGLASEAVSGGKIHINGQRVKPSKNVHVGDQLEIQRGQEAFVVLVEKLNDRRGPAREASLLYTETPDSQRKREEAALQNKLNAQMHPHSEKKPNKRDRRHIIRFIRKQ